MKTLKSLALASLLVAPMVGNASVINLGSIAAGTSVSIASGPLLGVFTDSYDFSSVGTVGISAFISSLAVNFGPAAPSITGFSAMLDGNALTAVPDQVGIIAFGPITFNTFLQGLAGGEGFSSIIPLAHNLSITGTSLAGGSYSGNIAAASVAAVPLPAGIWLFMTGLMGVLYTGKKKAQQA